MGLKFRFILSFGKPMHIIYAGCLLFLAACPVEKMYAQPQKVLVLDFEKDDRIPESSILIDKSRYIASEKENVIIKSPSWLNFSMGADEREEYMQSENIRYIIKGEFDHSNNQKTATIWLMDEEQQPLHHYQYKTSFRGISDFEEWYKETIDDFFYYIKTEEHRRKVVIVKFKLGDDDTTDFHDLHLDIPISLERKLVSNEDVSSAFVFKYESKEYEEKLKENSDVNLLNGAITLLEEEGNSDIIDVYIKIYFYETGDPTITISEIRLNKSSIDYAYLTNQIIESLKPMVAN